MVNQPKQGYEMGTKLNTPNWTNLEIHKIKAHGFDKKF